MDQEDYRIFSHRGALYDFNLHRSGRIRLSTPPLQQKSYDVNDLTLRFVDREDELDFLCEDFPSRRAQMSCGHSVTPTSLNKWCRKQLEEGKSRFTCGVYGCKAEWSMVEVCRMALLTPEEKSYFQTALARNAFDSRHNASGSRPCPNCKSPVVRQSETDLCVSCQVCTAKKRRLYEFCWQCLSEWRGPKKRSDRCDNDKCCNSALETLKSCPEMVFDSVSVSGCPSVRACPTCGSLLQHKGDQCKHLTCPRCKVKFCFVCLKIFVDCSKSSGIKAPCSRGVAPRQTSIPVWIYK